jgi:uncharacterized HhH-GPD family protein
MPLHLSGDPVADDLLSKDPLALLIGMVLDQQIPLDWAFRGPASMVERLGLSVPMDAAQIAGVDPDVLTEAFARPPSLHRYPRSMAERVQALAALVADEYGNDASRIWTEAKDGADLRARVRALPGFGEQKARIFVALLGKQLGVRPPGWEEVSEPFSEPGSFRSVADIVDAHSLDEVRRRKKEAKAAAKAAAGGGGAARAAGTAKAGAGAKAARAGAGAAKPGAARAGAAAKAKADPASKRAARSAR